MSARSRRFVATLLLVLAACTTNTAPAGFLLPPELAQSESWGGWMEVQILEEGTVLTVAGELIAATSDTIWILNEAVGRTLPTAAVREGKLTAYSPLAGNAAALAIAGTVSTLANGWFLAFTAPMWIIGGSIATGGQSRVPIHRTDRYSWSELSAFARFPAGMPTGMLVTDLRTKPR